MRSTLALTALLVQGCASTVYRVEGEATDAGGPARTACESEGWLVAAPTRADVAIPAKGTSRPETGLGLYHVGESSPESIPSLELPPSKSVERKRALVAHQEHRQIIAGSLGAAGLIAIAIGTVVFVNAFGSRTTIDAQGNRHEDNPVNGGRAALGGALVGVGFGFGIGGLVVNPSYAERTQANATRYVFLEPPDDAKSVSALVETYNDSVRKQCARPAP